jgi:hypothetical protein
MTTVRALCEALRQEIARGLRSTHPASPTPTSSPPQATPENSRPLRQVETRSPYPRSSWPRQYVRDRAAAVCEFRPVGSTADRVDLSRAGGTRRRPARSVSSSCPLELHGRPITGQHLPWRVGWDIISRCQTGLPGTPTPSSVMARRPPNRQPPPCVGKLRITAYLGDEMFLTPSSTQNPATAPSQERRERAQNDGPSSWSTGCKIGDLPNSPASHYSPKPCT